ncbi:hypothetical protein KX255_23600, partial [Escherichia coli]|uniref:hypothetical protein n=1 Tax=Escherichia coli TaxID=562 RepID=UPI001C57B24E
GWPRSVQGLSLGVCSAAATQNCRLDASDGVTYLCLPPRAFCSEQESLQLQKQPGASYRLSLIEQCNNGFAHYCVRQPFVFVSVHA